MDWFKRIKEVITTTTNQKKETPAASWYKCPKCKKPLSLQKNIKQLMFARIVLNYHRINSDEYFKILFDKKIALQN